MFPNAKGLVASRHIALDLAFVTVTKSAKLAANGGRDASIARGDAAFRSAVSQCASSHGRPLAARFSTAN
jgi:hypothetical protein